MMRGKSFVCAITVMTILGVLPWISSAGAATGASWGTAQLIETSPQIASGPQISVDSSGNAIVVWEQDDGTSHSIWSNRYVVGMGWGTKQLVKNSSSDDPETIEVAVDGSGNAIIVWDQYDGAIYSIWSDRYVVGPGWGTAQLVETSPQTASGPQISVDSPGNAIAVWQQYDGAVISIWSSRYVVGTGWGTAQLIETNDSMHAEDPEISAASSGNATVVWQQGNEVWSNRYVVGMGWETAQLVGNSGYSWAGTPEVSVDASGNAIAVWKEYDGTVHHVCSNRYVVGTGWGTAQLIETNDSGDAYGPQVSAGDSGNAVTVWVQDDGGRYDIYANQYNVGTGWGTAQLIEAEGGNPLEPQVSVDQLGNAVAVWKQDELYQFYYSIWSNRYVVGTGWGTAQIISNNYGGGYPQVSMDSSGNAIAVWWQDPGSIWSNRYSVSGQPSDEVEIGVNAGDWIKLDYKISGSPSTVLPKWMKVEFLSVDETNATVRVTLHMSDGTEENATELIDIAEGGEALHLTGFVVPANLTTGDTVYMSEYGAIAITGETKRKYAGATRTTVYSSFSEDEIDFTYYWDKQTGVLVEVRMSSGAITATAKASETNMWEAQSSGLLSNSTVLYALVIAAIVIVVAVALLVMRRRKEPELLIPEAEEPPTAPPGT